MVRTIASALLCLGMAFVIWTSATRDAFAQQMQIYQAFLIDYDHKNYVDMLAGRDPYTISDISQAAASRMTFEPLLLQHAAHLGGCNCRIDIAPYPFVTPHARTLEQIRLGQIITHPVGGFHTDPTLAEGFLLSDPILPGEEFFVGLYTHENREDILKLTDPDAIKKLRFAVGRNWAVDNTVLDQAGFQKVPADDWQSLLALLKVGRADVVLQPFFSGEDLSFVDRSNGERYEPIPNVKMAFRSDRVFVVSAAHPDGAEFHAALNRGLAILRRDGILKRGLINAGVINEHVENFYEIKP